MVSKRWYYIEETEGRQTTVSVLVCKGFNATGCSIRKVRLGGVGIIVGV